MRLAALANEIGRTADAKELQDIGSKIRSAYNKKFLVKDAYGSCYLDNRQTANAISLAFGLCPEILKGEVLGHLVKSLEDADYSLTVGVLGLYAIFDALSDNGRTDVAYRIVSKRTYPSWGYWFKQGGYWLNGATSMWEFWDGHGSHNHMFLGGKMNAFLVKNLAGISPMKPGYAEVLIKPGVVGDLTDMRTSVFSPKGKIETDWKKNSSLSFMLETSIPVNSTAEVYLPLLENKISDAVVTEGDKKVFEKGASKDNRSVKFMREENGYLVFKVGSGTYKFSLEKK